ncbi:MAG: hypothetical protein CBC13_05845 [Planctomycetia bacterium TMED53]|nr:MAG: hypothetical protein CBC13_05845 [Planctomycetia bacterium TMED53]
MGLKGIGLQRGRILFLALVFFGLSSVVVARLYRLQVVDWRTFSLKAASTHRSVLYTPGPRGEIQDRNGTVLAESVPEIQATFLLSELEPVRWVARRISKILRQTPDEKEEVEDRLYKLLEDVREGFRADVSSGKISPEVAWRSGIDKETGSELESAIRKRPESFPGVRLQRGDDSDSLYVDPMKLFAGELGVRRLADLDGRFSSQKLWDRVERVYDQVKTNPNSEDGAGSESDGGKSNAEIAAEKNEIYRYRRHFLIKGLAPELIVEISLRPQDWPGIYLEEIQRREHPYSPLFGQLLGRTAVLTKEHLNSWEERGDVLINYMRLKDLRTIETVQDVAHHLSDQVGRSGLERFLEERLRGNPGAHLRTVDYMRRPVDGEGTIIEAKSGQDIRLTVDAELSTRGIEWLQEALDRAWLTADPSTTQRGEVDTAALVLLDVKSGEIIGMSSLPQQGLEVYRDKELYNARAPQRNIDKPEESERAIKEARKIGWFYDRCLDWAIEPGSAFKPLVALLAYSQGVLDDGEEIVCEGFYDPKFPKRNKCRNHSNYGPMDLKESLSKSCNVFFYELGNRLGTERIVSGGRELGLWRPVIGPYVEYRTGEIKKLSPANTWIAPTTNPIGTAIGSGFTVTPLQMAQAALFIARRGDMIPVKLFMDSDQWISEDDTVPSHDLLRNLETSHFDAVIEGMVEAARTGTARPRGESRLSSSNLKDFSAAVKTGTIKVPSEKKLLNQGSEENHAWMIGFAPFDDPQVAFAAVLQHQPEGGSAASLAVTEALEWLEDHWGMEFGR